MLNRTPTSSLDMELARARHLLAAGRREEALALALTLLHQALGDMRHHLLALQDNLARVKGAANQTSLQTEAGQSDYPVRPPGGGRYYH